MAYNAGICGDFISKFEPGISAIQLKIAHNLFRIYAKNSIGRLVKNPDMRENSPTGITKKLITGIATRFPNIPDKLKRLNTATDIGKVAIDAINVVISVDKM